MTGKILLTVQGPLALVGALLQAHWVVDTCVVNEHIPHGSRSPSAPACQAIAKRLQLHHNEEGYVKVWAAGPHHSLVGSRCIFPYRSARDPSKFQCFTHCSLQVLMIPLTRGQHGTHWFWACVRSPGVGVL